MSTQDLSEQESLHLITRMIQSAKGSHYHESGTGAIMWGCVVGFCGLASFAQRYWGFNMGFDVWILTLVAIIPQVFISINDRKRMVIKTYEQKIVDAVWIVYGISIFALIAYFNIVPGASAKIMADQGVELFQKNVQTGEIKSFVWNTPSASSLMMIIYAFPTLVTGLGYRFKPMIIGAVACYIFFIISLFTTTTFDQLLNGLSGIGNWLIPGIILRNRYVNARRKNV